jgi:hypothetical protein
VNLSAARLAVMTAVRRRLYGFTIVWLQVAAKPCIQVWSLRLPVFLLALPLLDLAQQRDNLIIDASNASSRSARLEFLLGQRKGLITSLLCAEKSLSESSSMEKNTMGRTGKLVVRVDFVWLVNDDKIALSGADQDFPRHGRVGGIAEGQEFVALTNGGVRIPVP